ncbi:MAG: glycosyltransferase family 4 protein [bacterium]
MMKIGLMEAWFPMYQGGMERIRHLGRALAILGHEVHCLLVKLSSAEDAEPAFGTGLCNLHVHTIPIVDLTRVAGKVSDSIREMMGTSGSFIIEIAEELGYVFMPPHNQEAYRNIGQTFFELLGELDLDVLQITDGYSHFGQIIKRIHPDLHLNLLLHSYPTVFRYMEELGPMLESMGKPKVTYEQIIGEFRQLIRIFDSIWAVSPEFADTASADLHIPRDEIQVHEVGIWTDEFFHEPVPGFKEKRGWTGEVLLFVGRIEPQKGLHNLISAFPAVLDRFPDARLVIAGNMSDFPSYAISLKSIARALGIHDRVNTIGFVSGEVKQNVYAACDLFISPYIASDSAGITLLEAMASAKPAVVSNLGFAGRIVSERLGRRCPPNDTMALADSIVGLLQDTHQRQAMGQAARDFVRQKYNWTQLASRAAASFQSKIKSFQ